MLNPCCALRRGLSTVSLQGWQACFYPDMIRQHWPWGLHDVHSLGQRQSQELKILPVLQPRVSAQLVQSWGPSNQCLPISSRLELGSPVKIQCGRSCYNPFTMNYSCTHTAGVIQEDRSWLMKVDLACNFLTMANKECVVLLRMEDYKGVGVVRLGSLEYLDFRREVKLRVKQHRQRTGKQHANH